MERNAFLVIFGKANAKIIDYLLDQQIDVTINDICQGAGLSRKTADTFLSLLVEKGIIKVTRTVGNTKMYAINRQNLISKKLSEINDLVLKQQEQLLEQTITS